ncbi:MAG: hypothetical protein J0L78_03030 [Planctomycetes bacterium]|nr:hypothetical protein [Planctomycetota bacterium]
MGSIRELLAKPAVGWTAAGLAVLIALFFFWRSVVSRSTYDLSRLSESVTVRFTDTDEEVQFTRGDFERQVREIPGTLSTDKGILNPKTGKRTGVLVAKREWDEVVNRLNSERDWARQNSPFGAPPAANSSPKQDK